VREHRSTRSLDNPNAGGSAPDVSIDVMYSVRLLSCSHFSGLRAPLKEGAVGPTIEEFESIFNTDDHPGW